MSDTPRTDAIVKGEWLQYEKGCRTLERELNAARERIAELEKGITEIKAGTRIGWFMTDLGAKCGRLLNL